MYYIKIDGIPLTACDGYIMRVQQLLWDDVNFKIEIMYRKNLANGMLKVIAYLVEFQYSDYNASHLLNRKIFINRYEILCDSIYDYFDFVLFMERCSFSVGVLHPDIYPNVLNKYSILTDKEKELCNESEGFYYEQERIRF